MVFSGYMPSSGIAGSYGSSIFSFLRKVQGGLNFNEWDEYITSSAKLVNI